ncbi:unnamed protein product [Pylaiella littoralis]
MCEPAPGFRLDVKQANHLKEREKRRARQEAYRRELNSQVAEGEERRKLHAQRNRELEERDEQKSATYNPWGKPGSGAPLRQPDGALVTNVKRVKAYHRAKLQGLIAQDLSPNEIGDNEQPFGFTLTARGELEHRSPLRMSRSVADQADIDKGQCSESATAVSLSPPRNRYRFDRLPPEDQNYLDRRMKERRELEVALLRQVEEKRAVKEREDAAKRAEDAQERIRVLRILAEERATNRRRVRDKNLRADEVPPPLYPANAAPSMHEHQPEALGERASRRSSVAWQLQQHTESAPQGRRISRSWEKTTARRGGGGGDGGGIGRGARETGVWLGGGAMGLTGRTGGSEAKGGDEGDRTRILLILKRLEDHGRMLNQLASELAVVKSAPQPAPGKV